MLIVLVSAATLLLVAAVGAAASSGTLGSAKAGKAVISLVTTSTSLVTATKKSEPKGDEAKDDNGKHKGECHPPKKTHKHSTPGHKHHPCGDDGGDD